MKRHYYDNYDCQPFRDSSPAPAPDRHTAMFRIYDNVTVLLQGMTEAHSFSPTTTDSWRDVMAASILIAGALLAQSAASTITVEAGTDRIDVAYEELAQGRPDIAIARIRANHELDADEPAALINLGTAHARLGHSREAEACYRAAIASDNRYDLELADGRWMDSRRAARLAVTMLAKGETLALR